MKTNNGKKQSRNRSNIEETEEIQELREYKAHLESMLESYGFVDNSFAEWKNKIAYPKSPDYYVTLQNNCMNYLENFLSKNFGINLIVPVTFEVNIPNNKRNPHVGAYWKVEFREENNIKLKIERFKVIYEVATNLTPESYLELVVRTACKLIATQILTPKELDKRIALLRKNNKNILLFEDDCGVRLRLPSIFASGFLEPLEMSEIVISDNSYAFHDGKPYAYFYHPKKKSSSGIGVPSILEPMCVYLKTQKEIDRMIMSAQNKNLELRLTTRT